MTNNGWISVKDRLPNIGDVVLILANDYDETEQAVEAWNRRAEDAPAL